MSGEYYIEIINFCVVETFVSFCQGKIILAYLVERNLVTANQLRVISKCVLLGVVEQNMYQPS